MTFKSTSYADITMFGEVAVTLLKMMRQSGQVPGAIVADQVADALTALKEQLEKVESESADSDEDDDAPISLATRAQPLIKLLEASVDGGADVIWEK